MTIDFQPIATGGSANVESQAQFLVDLAPGGALQNGFQSGVAPSAKYNKVMRQTSIMSAAIANLIGNTLGVSVLDDGNLASLITNLTSAIQQTAAAGAWGTGDVKLTMKSVADPTWVLCNDGSIGDASSAATTRANADTAALFALIWTNVSDTFAPVSGGRGASAVADFAAHKKITLTKMLGRALAIAGAGSGLTARALGTNVGEETHLLTGPESGVAAHAHNIPVQNNDATGLVGRGNGGGVTNVPTDVSGPTNAASAHNNMQPTSFLNAMIKL